MSKVNHKFTDEIVCPHCGDKWSDSWEVSPRDEEIGLQECENCEKSFYAHRHIEVTYSTQKANYGTCKGCQTENVVIENYISSIGNYHDLCVECGENEIRRLKSEYFIDRRNE